MSRAKSALDQKDKMIRVLVFVVITLAVLLANAHVRVVNVPKDYTFFTPPDLSLGGQARIGEVPATSAFNFAFTMLGGVNTWLKDGSTEFGSNLDKDRYYFDNKFLASLKDFAKKEQSNNRGRSRQFSWEKDATPALSANNGFIVESKGNNVFNITFAARVVDEIQGYEIKNDVIVYHLIVEPYFVPRQYNPWQMKIKGQFAQPERL